MRLSRVGVTDPDIITLRLAVVIIQIRPNQMANGIVVCMFYIILLYYIPAPPVKQTPPVGAAAPPRRARHCLYLSGWKKVKEKKKHEKGCRFTGNSIFQYARAAAKNPSAMTRRRKR